MDDLLRRRGIGKEGVFRGYYGKQAVDRDQVVSLVSTSFSIYGDCNEWTKMIHLMHRAVETQRRSNL